MTFIASYIPKKLPASFAKIGVLSALFLSACEAQIYDFTVATNSDLAVEKVVEENEIVEVQPATQIETALEVPSSQKPIILQDGVDAFLGYRHVEIPKNLSGTYPELNKGILAVILAFNLREMANAEGVSSWAKIRTSSAGEITWQYELSSLPDDVIYTTEYKVYFEKIDADYQIVRIGNRFKCYYGDNPKQWTVKLCT